MTVENTTPESTAPAPAASSVAAPVAAVDAAPSVQTPSPAVVEKPTPVVAEAPVTEVKAEPVVEKPVPTTVLGKIKEEAAPVADTKPAATEEGETAPKVEGETEEGGQSEEPATLPPYEDFQVPEGLPEDFKFDEEKIGEFKNQLLEFEKVTKAPREEVTKFAQSLLNDHAKAQQEVAQRVADIYQQTWEKQKATWKESFEKDPEIGGNRIDTTTAAALQFIRTHGGTEAQQTEFQNLMESTGIGNHPAMIRMLANANRAMSESGPLPAQKPAFQPTSKVAKRYGSN